MMRYVRCIIWLLVIVVGVVFTLINDRSVEIDYYFGSAKMNIFLPLLILIVWVIGVGLGYLAAVPQLLKLRHTVRKLSRLEQQAGQQG